jgi:hypothetical protein
MNSKAQGNIGVAMAIAYYSQKGFPVLLPLGDNCRYDLVVDIDGHFAKVQCKTSTFQEGGSYRVELRTCGGNKSGSSIKKLSSEEVDLVFVYSFDGRCYEFPARVLSGQSRLTLGPTKQRYKVMG